MKRVLMALLLTAPSFLTHASEYPTDAELKTLPNFCMVKSKMRGTPQERTEIAKYGELNWVHIHHYCVALVNVDRARRAARPEQVKAYLNEAAGQYAYVNGGFTPDFWLRPQLYVEHGKVLVRLNRQGEALRLFGEAVRLSPGYLTAYMSMIDTYKALGMKSEALEAATAGLRKIPDSTALQKAYLDLGGSKPFPEPAQVAVPNPSKNDASPHADAAGDGDVPKSTSDTSGAPSSAAEPSEGASAASIERGCRFCPPDEIQQKWRESFRDKSNQ